MKPSIPRGTRDFGPAQMLKRQYILDTVRKNLQLFGFQPIETPAMENISTLTGKYGEEGDQLIYKILNSRIHENKNKDLLRNEFELSLSSARNSPELTEKALRYDLTVPFARYVVMHQHELVFPFKRYQIQPVWRADRPQKGRYREFYQCDADVIGSNSLINEIELIAMIDATFKDLNIPVVLKFNNRKILGAISEKISEPDNIIAITVALDKLEKIGKDGVNKELSEKGISPSAIEQLQPLLDFKGDNNAKLSVLKQFLEGNELGRKGIEEVEYLLQNSNMTHADIELDITLARGLTYYTGSIFEVKTTLGNFDSSILGGGRYDNLTGIFGLKDMSGVGISFGVDRIYDVMTESHLFPAKLTNESATRILFAHFDEATQLHCLQLAAELRKKNVSCEVYPDITKKTGKQFDYANKKEIPFVCTVGSNEIASQLYSLKNMATGEQRQLNLQDLITIIKKH
jgi:histidyl-tRNA synthetase